VAQAKFLAVMMLAAIRRSFSFTILFEIVLREASQRLVLAAAAAQARRLRLKTTLLARGAYPKRRSRCPLQTVLGNLWVS
jgi:hypothetical protein